MPEPSVPQVAIPEPSTYTEPPYGAVEYWTGWQMDRNLIPESNFDGLLWLMGVLVLAGITATFLWSIGHNENPKVK